MSDLRALRDSLFDLPIGENVDYSRGYSAAIADVKREIDERLRAALAEPPQETGLRAAAKVLADLGHAQDGMGAGSPETCAACAVDAALEGVEARFDAPDDGWTTLANDIRLVDGNHDLGAGELAGRLYERGWRRGAEPEQGSLDAERLARALARLAEVGPPAHLNPDDAEDHWPSYVEEASDIVAEYRRLGGSGR